MKPAIVAVTFFSDRAAMVKREEELPPEELMRRIAEMVAPEKVKLPWLKLARFGSVRSIKGCLRHDGNVLTVSGGEGDYDGGEVTFERAVAIAKAAGLWCIVYTSPSHCPGAPRWRVLVFFSWEWPPAERYRFLARLNGIYGGILAVESFTLSQSYYFGRVAGAEEFKVELIDGTPIDLLDGLPEIGRPNGAGVTNGKSELKSDDSQDGGRDDSGGFNFSARFPGVFNEAALVAQITSGAGYHPPCVKLLGKWANLGVSQDDARRRLESYLEQVPEERRDRRWHERYGDISRCVSDIYLKESKKPALPEEPAPIGAEAETEAAT